VKKNYIGLACTWHDPAIAIVNHDGEVVFAEAAERYLQSKRSISYATDDFNRMATLIKDYCDPDAELVVAKSWGRNWFIKEQLMQVIPINMARRIHGWSARFSGKQLDDPRHQPYPAALNMMFALPEFAWQAQRDMSVRTSRNLKFQPYFLNRGIRNNVIVRNYEHHLTHAVTAVSTSPFSEAVCAVVDGYGEGTSTSYYYFSNDRLEPLKGTKASPGSLGGFYQIVCELCGFESFQGEEWKVMGLAPYGTLDERVYQILRPLIRVDGLRIISKYSSKGFETLHRKAGRPPIEAANVACTGQLIFEEVLEELLTNLYDRGHSQNLICSGGCFLNSSWNGKILERTGFERLHIYAAPGDDGNAIGAALLAHEDDRGGSLTKHRCRTPFLGSRMSDFTMNKLQTIGIGDRARSYPGTVHRKTAELLAAGKIVGWVQDRAEFGPRALGNRSILADPRDPRMKERINAQVKFREEFRPFAPAILHEHGPKYFENYQETPYMERTLRFRPHAAALVPAVVHVNDTGRLQSVTAELHGKFHQLIQAFYELTGVPVVLNTSFNIMGKPMIHTVEDALGVFYTTGLDALIVEDLVIEKDAGGADARCSQP
jgi:carbamoyltransferase